MNKVKVRIGLEVIIEGDLKDWTDEGRLCIESAVEEWVANRVSVYFYNHFVSFAEFYLVRTSILLKT